MKHYGRIFTDGVKHHWVFSFSHDLAKNLNALGLELFERRESQ